MVVEEITLYILYLHTISKSGMNKALKLGSNTLRNTNSNFRPVYTQGSKCKADAKVLGHAAQRKTASWRPIFENSAYKVSLHSLFY